MAQIQPKSGTEQKPTKTILPNPNPAEEGNSWQFKFVMLVIVLGVLMLIFKSIGLF
jgi:hypothetical protein